MPVQLEYADGGTITDQKNNVVNYVNQLIDQVISARVGNDMIGVRRDETIEVLRGQFRPNIAEISGILDRFANGVVAGMGVFQAADKL